MTKNYFFLSFLLYFFSISSFKSQCSALFTFSQSANVISFTDSSVAVADSIVSWNWSFGNGLQDTIQHPSVTYSGCGSYIVTLDIATSQGCTSTFSDTITVPGQISGSYTYTVDTLTGSVQFYGSPNNSSYSFSWDFGDGNTGTGANPSNTYVAGNYTACMIISQANSACTADTVCDTIAVSVNPISCAVSWTNTSSGSLQIFNATPINFNDTYLWDFGDGNTGTNPIANNTYATSGTYTVCLDYTSSLTGCTAQFCDTVIISSAGCSMQLSYVNNGGGNYTFTANVTGGGIFPVVAWIFGDGGTGFGLNPTHQYTANGFNIVCAVLNPSPIPGCSDTVCTFVLVSGVSIGMEEYQLSKSLSIYPNPFSDDLSLQFELASVSDVLIGIYDVLGNLLDEVVRTSANEGLHQYHYSSAHLAPGAYFVKVSAGNSVVTRKLMKY